MKAFDYAIAETPVAALEAATMGYKFKAGGIDLVDRLKERTEESDKVVSIASIPGISGIHEGAEGEMVIGALTTLAELASNDYVRLRFPALAKSAGDAATPQIRAVATVGGNLCQRPRCWYYRSQDYPCLKKGGGTCYAKDGENHYHALFGGGPCYIVHPSNIAPALVAAGAQIVVRGKKSGEREVDARRFFVLPQDKMYAENVLQPDEMIMRIIIPNPPARSAWVQFKERQSFDWPLAGCAAIFTGREWRIVLGAVAPIPWQSEAAEKVLGREASVTPELAEKAADAALQGAAPMSNNAWRLRLARAAVRRAILLADGKEID